jgi:hypothetical protein
MDKVLNSVEIYAPERSGNTTFLPKIRDFLYFFSYFLKKLIQKLSEIRNLNFMASELDSESLSTLRKIIFKRDSPP